MNTQWVNMDDEGALTALLQRLAAHIPPSIIDELWIFPTRRVAAGESTVVVVTAFHGDQTPRRRVITAHFTVTRNRKGVASVEQKVEEQAIAPADAVDRVVEGVLRRLDEAALAVPRRESLGGAPERWALLLENLANDRLTDTESIAARGLSRY